VVPLQVHSARTLQLPASVLTIGSLDGVHLGHQGLIRQARERAEHFAVPLVAYTFDPPPKVYFQHTLHLTPLQEKIRRLEILGVDHIIVARFNADYVSRGVAIFLDELAQLNPLEVWEGSDFRFGRNRDGDNTSLSERFIVRILNPICCSEGKIISSSRIRTLLMNNELIEAEQLLGWSVPANYKKN
jgi:riboflavin kinase / FMN adenylyltransferase